MEWIGAKVDWIKKIKFFAHPKLVVSFRLRFCGGIIHYVVKCMEGS